MKIMSLPSIKGKVFGHMVVQCILQKQNNHKKYLSIQSNLALRLFCFGLFIFDLVYLWLIKLIKALFNYVSCIH